MPDDGERANLREYENRRIAFRPDSRGREAAERLGRDMRAVAATAEGVRLLSWLAGREARAASAFSGDSRDAYRLGRYHSGEELRAALEEALPRETYITIIFPKKEAT